MAGYNRIVMVGNLTRDPDYKQLTSGQAVCRLGLATNRQFKSRQSGDMVQEVCFVDIDVWGAQAESCRQYLQKGRQVLIEGRLKFDTWEDPNGQNRSKHTIVADRVVFLAAQETLSEERTGTQRAESNQQLDPNNPVEKQLIDQIEEIKTKVTAQKKSAEPADLKMEPAQVEPKAAAQPNDQPKSNGGEIAFKDEPPFQDDLPF